MSDVDFTDLKTRDGDGSHLSRQQVLYIEKYMRKVLKRLDLGYWRVWVARDLPNEGCNLMIHPTDGRRSAMLYVSETWWNESPDHRADITHEALHLAHHDQEEVIRRFSNDTGDVSPYVMHLIWSQFKMETERMVDSLSYVLAPTMPKWTPPHEKSDPPLFADTSALIYDSPPTVVNGPPPKVPRPDTAMMVPEGALTSRNDSPLGPTSRALTTILGSLPDVSR